MAKFVVGKPLSTKLPTIAVDAGLLPLGSHRFRLEVFGVTGVSSVADEVVIEVVDGTTVPTQPDRASPERITTVPRTTVRKSRRKI